MEESDNHISDLCQLIDLYWDDLSLDQQKEIETSNKSMKFFLNLEDYDRVEYEIRGMYNTFNNIEKWT